MKYDDDTIDRQVNRADSEMYQTENPCVPSSILGLGTKQPGLSRAVLLGEA